MTSFHEKTALFLILASLWVPSAVAGGGPAGGGATEATQLMNNAELVASVAKQSQMVAGQIRDYTQQVQQYMTMVQNLKQLPAAMIGKQLAPYKDSLQTAMQLYQAVDGVYTATDQARRMLASRQDEMRRLDMSPSQYFTYEHALALARGGQYKQKVDRDMQVLMEAEEKARVLAQMDTEISKISGNVEGLQTLAQQNQMMAGELIRMNQYLAQSQIDRNDEKRAQAESEAEAAARAKATADAAEADRARVEQMLKNGKVNASEAAKKHVCGQKGCGK